MILDINPNTMIKVQGQPYRAEEHSAFYEEDFRLDLVRIIGATPAHERWLLALLPEPHLMLLQRLNQHWLSMPGDSFVHEGEIFVKLYHGNAHRVRQGLAGRSKEGRMEYALLRANSGRVILAIGRHEEMETWIGITVPADAVTLPG